MSCLRHGMSGFSLLSALAAARNRIFFGNALRLSPIASMNLERMNKIGPGSTHMAEGGSLSHRKSLRGMYWMNSEQSRTTKERIVFVDFRKLPEPLCVGSFAKWQRASGETM